MSALIMPLPGERRFCPVCVTWSDAFRADGRGNPDRACPRCRSLERHRFQALLLPALVALDAAVALDVAPTSSMSALLDRLVPHRIGVDLDPAADGRTVTCRASLTHLPLPDACIDLLLCSHVLEHVPDDLAAMREMARVLAPGGVGVVVVPQRRGGPTDEDPDATMAERIRRFGQADHVRFYGDDFTPRLVASGLAVVAITPLLVPPAVRRTCALNPGEMFWLVRRAPVAPVAATGEVADDDLGSSLVAELLELMGRLEAQRLRAVGGVSHKLARLGRTTLTRVGARRP